jgi:hypothetical protein
MKFEDNIPPEIKTEIEDLVRSAKRLGVVVCGFAFSSEPKPFMMNFGSCSDYGDIALYTELCSIADEKRRQGLAIKIVPPVVQ